jgi:hypothetical protein
MKISSLYCYVTYNLVYDSVKWKILNLIQNPFLHSIENLTDDSIYHLVENPFGNSIGKLTQKMINKLNENF